MCPVCGKEFDSGAILMDRRLKNSFDTYTTTGYNLCPEHKKKYDKGYIALIVCDEKKSNITGSKIMNMEDAYRTGEIIHLRKKVFKDMFNIDEERPFVFCDTELRDKLIKMQKKVEK
jgi:hypothetical protein